MGRLVREVLARHDPARPPRGRRTAPAKGAERNFGAEDAAPRPAGCGVRAAGCAAADPDFGSEVGRDRSRHPGGGQARGVAARPRPLPRRGPHQRAPLRLATPAADRSRRAVCPRRRRRAEQSPPAVRRPSFATATPARDSPPRRGSSGAGSVQPYCRKRRQVIKTGNQVSPRTSPYTGDLGLAARRPDAYLHLGNAPTAGACLTGGERRDILAESCRWAFPRRSRSVEGLLP